MRKCELWNFHRKNEIARILCTWHGKLIHILDVYIDGLVAKEMGVYCLCIWIALCYALLWSGIKRFYQYSIGTACVNHTVPVKQPRIIWVNMSHDMSWWHDHRKTKHNKTVCIFMGHMRVYFAQAHQCEDVAFKVVDVFSARPLFTSIVHNSVYHHIGTIAGIWIYAYIGCAEYGVPVHYKLMTK